MFFGVSPVLALHARETNNYVKIAKFCGFDTLFTTFRATQPPKNESVRWLVIFQELFLATPILGDPMFTPFEAAMMA